MENTHSDDGDSWGSGLPCDLARCIGDRLDVLARICFRAVCRSWRAALPAGSVTSIPSPLVVLPATPKRDRALPLVRSVVDSCSSSSASTSSALALHVVVVDSEPRCVGSSGVWLAVADSDSVIRLVNALTLREAACLPPLPRSAGSTLQLNRGIYDHGHTIHKVAFSVKPPRARGSSYAHSAVALHRATGPGSGLALTFTRAGWDRWVWRQPTTTTYGYPMCSMDGHFDVAYCQRSGVYYVVTPLGSVWVLDMSAPVPTLEPLARCHESFLMFPTFTERRHLVVLSDGDGDCALSEMYLVIINNERVIVQRYMAGEPWCVVRDLRGRALLISSRAQSVLVVPPAASSVPWLRPDCVYWMTDNEYPDDHDGCESETEQEQEQEQGMMSPVWRFHVPTNTTDRFLRRQEQLGDHYWMLDWHNSLWLVP